MASKYAPEYIQDVIEDWKHQSGSNSSSLREFCEDWGIPRSTFQGWLKKSESLPEKRYYFAPKQDVGFSATSATSVGEVLRLLANELAEISSNLTYIANKL